MKKLRSVKQTKIAVIFKSAHTHGLMCDWSAGSDSYKRYVEGVAKNLLIHVKTKPDELVKISATLIGYAYDQYKPVGNEFREVDLAINIIEAMSDILRAK